MSGSRPTLPQPDSPRPPPRVVTRLSVDFVLHAARTLSRHFEGDLLGGLVLLALLQRHLAYGTANGEADAEKPVSAKSLARSLKAAPETMRRCVLRLAAKDWCTRIGQQGVVLSQTVAGKAKIAALLSDIRDDFGVFLSNLKTIGFDFDLMDRGAVSQGADNGTPAPAIAALPGIDAVIISFGLRIVEVGSAPFDNDYTLTCVFSAIMTANSSPFAYDPTETWRYGTRDTPPPDEARRPASIAEVSELLGIPYETARRHANRLVSLGACLRDSRKGLLIPMELMQNFASLDMGIDMARRFSQMVGELKRLGFDFRSVKASPR